MLQAFSEWAGLGPAPPQLPLTRDLRCYSVVMKGKPQLEYGDKIVLPQSFFDELLRRSIQYPMMFRITNNKGGINRHTHCSVMEFTAEEGRAYIPHWMMESLALSEADIVTIANVTLKKGTFCKLRPHSKEFLEISDHRAVLEKSLRSFSCLTLNEPICFEYTGKKFLVDVLELKPDNAVSIIETNMDVDFAAPKDYVEPSVAAGKKKAGAAGAGAGTGAGAGGAAGGASGGSATGRALRFGAAPSAGGAAGGAAGAGLTTPSPSKFGRSGFVPFAGEGRRLDDSGGGGAGGGAGAGDGAAASPVSGVMAAMAEARARRAASSGGGTVLSPTRRPTSAQRSRTLNKFEAQRRASAFGGSGKTLKD